MQRTTPAARKPSTRVRKIAPARRWPSLSFDRLECRDLPAAFTLGNLVVYRVGDGSAALTSAATPVFLDEFTTLGGPVQSIAMPTAVSGANRRLTESGTTFGEGILNRTEDGRYLLATGYDADVGTTSITGTASATVNRVVARIGNDGIVDSSTALPDGYSGTAMRSAASPDGFPIWTSGNGATGAIRLTSFGATGPSTSITTTFTNLRGVSVFGNQLYTGASVPGLDGLASVGFGLPTTSGQVTTVLPGFPTSGSSPFPSPWQFVFNGPNEVYVADSRTNGQGGLQKWVTFGGNWSLAYTILIGANQGLVGVTGDFSGPNPVLYGITAETSGSVPNQIVRIEDIGAGTVPTPLATAPTNQYFRGIAFAPVPAGATSDTVALTSNAPSVPVGAQVTFTATVSGSATLPTGHVTFQFNGATIGVGQLSPAGGPNMAQAEFTTSTLPVGASTITAVYGGDTTYLTGNAKFTQTVTGTVTTVSVTSNAALPDANNQSVTFTTTITPTSGTTVPTGTVTFSVDGVAQAPVNVTPGSGASGIATLVVSTNPIQASQQLTPGEHTISAVYTPTGDFVGGTAQFIQKVKPNPFGAGNILVYRAGDGTNLLTANGNVVFIDEYTSAAGQTAPVQSIVMPTTTVAGGNHALITCSQQSLEGQLSLSGDGQYVFLTGYDAAPGGSVDVHLAPAGTIPRTIGRIKFDGTIDTSVALTDLADGSSVRGVYSPDGNQVYATGVTGGIRYIPSYTPATTTSTQIDDGANSLNALGVAGGQLFVSGSSSAGTVKVSSVGTGLPTTSGQTLTILPGIPTGSANSPGFPVGFFFADLDQAVPGPDTLYIADDGPGFFNGTITKWSLIGGNWTLSDTITSTGAGTGIPTYLGLTGSVTGSVVTLYSTYGNGGNANTGPGYVFSITDSGGFNAAIPDHTVTTLATLSDTSNTVFRGVSIVPTGSAAAPTVTATSVNAGATQRSRVTTLDVTFSAQVTFATTAANAFTLTRNGGGAVSFTATANVVGGVTVVTLNAFTGADTEFGSLNDGRYTLTALANQISAGGTPMAANYTFGDPDGLFRFYGDINADRRVDISDFGFFSLAYLTPANYTSALDYNQDLRIDIADFGQFSVRYFTTLP